MRTIDDDAIDNFTIHRICTGKQETVSAVPVFMRMYIPPLQTASVLEKESRGGIFCGSRTRTDGKFENPICPKRHVSRK